MATQPVYIEPDEELTEVVERLRRAPGAEVPIVLPPRSRLGQSRFNFQLLREYAGRMGKRVAIISGEPAVQALATEHGFQSYGSVDRYLPVSHDFSAATAPAATAVAPEPVSTFQAPPRAFEPAPAPAPTPMPTPAPAPAPTPAIHRPSRPTKPFEAFPDRDVLKLSPNRSLLYGGAALVLIVGLVAMFLFVPSATVTLTARAQPFTEAMDITSAPGGGPVAVRVADDSQQLSQQVKTTGIHITPAQPATGQTVWSNNCPLNNGLDIPKGERVSGGGQEFATQQELVVPQGGTANVGVIATVPGVAGNVPAHTINTIENNPFADNCLTVDNPGATTGGAEQKQDPMLSQQDFDNARSDLTTKLKQKIHDDLTGQLKAGEKLDDNINFDTPSFLADHKPGDLVPQFTASMSLKGEGAFYSEKDVRDQLRQNLVKNIPNGQAATDNPIQTDYQITQSQPGGHLTFHGTANGYIAPRLDFEQIKSQLAGKSNSSANAFLRSLHVVSYTVQQSPFSLPLLPLLSSRITVKYVVEQGAPASG
jgi:baseplate J-like protein